MKKVLDFLEWHKKEYGHAYNHEMDLIEVAKKATRYANYVHQSRVNAISDDDIDDKIESYINQHGYKMHDLSMENECITHGGVYHLIVEWYKNKLLKQ